MKNKYQNIKTLKNVFLKSPLFYPLIISPFLFLFYKFYIRKVSAFGCFDDCFNIVGGYFLTQGKTLYSDIFFNHQPLMAYISFGIQFLTDPINIFSLILAHRNFIFTFSILMNLLIAARFRWAGVGFIFFYEATKFYVFGDRFLAEALIVYPLVYLFGLFWYKFNNKRIYKIEYIFTAFFTWFIIFLREPFIPVAILLFVLILWDKKFTKVNFLSILLLIFLSLCLILLLPLQDYIFNVYSLNRDTISNYGSSAGNITSVGALKIFFYPLYIFFSREWGYFRTILIILSLLFILFSSLLTIRTKKWKIMGLIILILGLANIRYVASPGHAFYEAFHMAPWYGLFIFTIFIFFQSLWKQKISEKLKYLFMAMLVALFIFMLFPGKSFIWEKNDRHVEFINNYGNYLQYGEAARILSSSKSTLFVDGFDELIYWQAKTASSYKYLWYTSFMPDIPLYSKARAEMFKKNPPDIYYGSCPKEIADTRLMPRENRQLYVNLYAYGKPTCLYIKRSYISKISKNQWQKLKEFQFYLLN